MTWYAGRGGRRVELLHPDAASIDWAEIAHALATTNRYGGHAETPVSVGQHTLIMVEQAPPALKAHVLLHDAHEAPLGDTTTPRKEAESACAAEMFGDKGVLVMEGVRRELERRHDAAIYEAAGLPLPTAEQKRLVKALDLRALATERRDFFGIRPGAPAWAAGHLPFAKVYRFRPVFDVEDALNEAFRLWLPALRRAAA